MYLKVWCAEWQLFCLSLKNFNNTVFYVLVVSIPRRKSKAETFAHLHSKMPQDFVTSCRHFKYSTPAVQTAEKSFNDVVDKFLNLLFDKSTISHSRGGNVYFGPWNPVPTPKTSEYRLRQVSCAVAQDAGSMTR